MPIYEYQCTSCNYRFEKKQGFHEEPKADCPRCNQAARRLFQPAPIIFKGDGFYVTDYRKEPADSSSETSKSST